MSNLKTIILDRAHGSNITNKQSPCGSYKESEWSTEQQFEIELDLRSRGIPTLLVPEKTIDIEIGLTNRVNIYNQLDYAFVFSLHSNASRNDGRWGTARGVEVWTSRGYDQSDIYAKRLYNDILSTFPEIHKDFCQRRYWRRGDTHGGLPGKEANFTVLTSKHPGMLFEWLFHDNKIDLADLKNPQKNKRLRKVIANRLEKISLGIDKIPDKIVKEKRV